ncbi:MAG: recombinase family protein [Paludibacteraceae bacterium]|nr:recombinase family protein [Paludibacteraceae bacterium]
MIIGYARVSTNEQNLDRQIDELFKVGRDKILTEKVNDSIYDRSVVSCFRFCNYERF